ncbi:aminoglycoside phosphotransferase (APT) family kinase protein [Nonomuraea dietziae]|uniref:Aminoglycoside phosphotransferase (APT) family kinase protein n=2 Tax=Nonomuraea dietziae TaxID=65515 RepID=A0A7W5YSJ1_9ACTN|nr:aminoglycoside phosphotransferase (APT) family kinase protein [Nonomuraea dietziae]
MDVMQGWDSVATLVDGRWIDRRPRRPEVADLLIMETRVMPWLAPQLPLKVPVPRVMDGEPLVVRHEAVPGRPVTELTAVHGRQLGAFLQALHGADVAGAVEHGLRGAEAALQERRAFLGRFREVVVPMVPERAEAEALLDAVEALPADTVVHADLGPEHLLAVDGELTGVIDFSDAHVGDRAIDLSWLLYGTPPPFAEALAEAYAVTGEERGRALLWHRLGPWHEVLYGLDTDDPSTVVSGLEGVRDRLTP